MENFENFDFETELEPYHRKNFYARDFYIDIVSHFPMCIGCPYFELGCDYSGSSECEITKQIETSLDGGY